MSLRQSQVEVERLVTEAAAMGIEVDRALYRELSFDLKNGESKVFIRGQEVQPEEAYGLWFRVAGTKSGKYTEARNLAIRILETKGVKCVNSRTYLSWTRMGKIAQHGVFLQNDIPIVPTRIFYTKDQVLEREEWDFPVIVKHERGSQGKSVRKFEHREELVSFLDRISEKNLGMFLWQKALPTRWDLRIIVVDGEAIGAMKRSASDGEFRSNFSLGGAVENWRLDREEKELAEKAARVCGLDYGGGYYEGREGKNYILEVNRQCQFQGFEKLPVSM